MTDEKNNKHDMLSEAQAARLLGVTRPTLSNWRHAGKAPEHYRYPSGTVRYPRPAVVAWRSRWHNPPEPKNAGKGGHNE